MNKLIPIIILLALMPATPIAEYIGASADMPIVVIIVPNCDVDGDRWCSERGKCCNEVKDER